MRVLFVSNFYPPVVYGGYEQLCREVGVELVRRGHQLGVLTARGTSPDDGPGSADDGIAVYRRLHLEVVGGVLHTARRALRDRPRLERENLAQVREALSSFAPDAVMVWGMWNVPHSVPAAFETLVPDRVAYYICDYWPSLPSAYLQHVLAPSTRRATALPKQILSYPLVQVLRREARPSLRLERAYCVSRATRDLLVQAGLPLAQAGVIYGNINLEQFSVSHAVTPPEQGALRLLYSGRLAPEKGVHTAIHALARLPESHLRRLRLQILGSGLREYERKLRRLVAQYGLAERVHFRASVARAEMPAVLAEHDVLIFPSEWQAPFARAVLEAMAAGLVVVGSTAGGTPEVLAEDRTGLLFPAGDSAALARQIARLLDEPATRARLASAGRRHVAEHFTIAQTVDGIEAVLQAMLGNRAARGDLVVGAGGGVR
jgi:glycosyltransferase involved in cell wall biosynthesis